MIKFLIDPFAAIVATEHLAVYEPTRNRPPREDDPPKMPDSRPCRLRSEGNAYVARHTQITRRERCISMVSHACLASASVAKGEPITVTAGLLL